MEKEFQVHRKDFLKRVFISTSNLRAGIFFNWSVLKC